MSESYRSPRFWHLLSLLCLFAVVVAWLKAVLGVPLPFVDIFLFKEAGARLALDGIFAVRNLPHMEHDQVSTYAYYVPIYPFFYGLWASLLGVNLPASILFDQAIKLVRTILLFIWLWPQIKSVVESDRIVRYLLLVSLCALSLLPFYSDRPDDLALSFGLLGCLLPLRFRGVALGLVAGTSPAAGVLFGALYLSDLESRRELAGTLAISILVFSAILSPVVIADPGAPARFWQQVPLSVRPMAGIPWGLFFREWVKTFWYAGKEWTAPILIFGVFFFWLLKIQRLTSKQIRWGAIALGYAVLSTFIWNYQARYLWFSYALLYGTLLVGAMKWRAVFLGLMVVPLLPCLAEGRAIISAMAQEHSPRLVNAIEQHLLPGARLAVSADSYFMFREKHRIDLAHYVCRSLDKYDYIFLSRQTLNTEKVEPPCRGKRRHFELAQDFGEAGVLFARTERKASN